MGILGKLVLGFLGLCILLPGLCFGLFGLTFLAGIATSGIETLLYSLVWFVIAAALIWAAIAVFRQIGK